MLFLLFLGLVQFIESTPIAEVLDKDGSIQVRQSTLLGKQFGQLQFWTEILSENFKGP